MDDAVLEKNQIKDLLKDYDLKDQILMSSTTPSIGDISVYCQIARVTLMKFLVFWLRITEELCQDVVPKVYIVQMHLICLMLFLREGISCLKKYS